MPISRFSKLSPLTHGRGKPVVCITMGYPAGIGPEVIAKSLANPDIKGLADFLIIGDAFVFGKALAVARKKIPYTLIKDRTDINFSKNNILLLDLEDIARNKFAFGRLNSAYGSSSIDYIREAVSLIKEKKADLLVTAPIHKHAAARSGFKHPGHTEYLADLTATKNYAMMFAGGPLKIVLVTTHLPIKDVSHKLSEKNILNALTLMNSSLKQYFGLAKPRIAVCGLNPHAGEGGIFGGEEQRVIAPAIKKAKKKGIDAYGPIAADVLFHDLYKGGYNAALCMYHDQGLVALKMIARDESVNITLGLPFIRTSPAHGTALDIAGKNIASCESMKQAIRIAVSMFNNQ